MLFISHHNNANISLFKFTQILIVDFPTIFAAMTAMPVINDYGRPRQAPCPVTTAQLSNKSTERELTNTGVILFSMAKAYSAKNRCHYRAMRQSSLRSSAS